MEPIADWVTAAPAPALRGLVDGYVGYRLVGFPPGVHRGLPARHLTFIVSIGPTIDVATPSNPAHGAASYRCVLSGLQASPAQIAHDGTQEGVAIELSPLGCRALLGVHAGPLWDLSVESSAVIGRAGDELWERLQPPAPWSRRFAVCDEILTRRLTDERVPPALAHCWERIVSSGGQTPIGQLAAEVGYSRQHLARRFRSEFGLGPKLAARVVRFERAQRALRSGPTAPSLAEVAARCGYADQAHLWRDFNELAGCSPSELLAGEELPNVQDPDPPTRP